MSTTKDAYVRCPFYRGMRHKSMTIMCEGPDGSKGVLVEFETTEAFGHHMNYYCDEWYKYCPIYCGRMTQFGEELVRE